MPKFMYTVILSTGALWYGIFRILTQHAPESTGIILLFLVLLFLAITLTLSIPLYFIFLKRAARFTELREIYRKSIKIGGYVSLGIVILLGLNILELLNLITAVLFGLLYFMGILSLKKKL